MADTIFALSSGALPAAIAVIRISGDAAGEALQAIAGKLPSPRRAALRTLRDAAGEPLDQALVLWLPGPHTELGEDMAELHLHGSRAVVDAVGTVLSTIPTVRLAEAGEFTRRAFANGKLDLAQVEGLGDLLAAETEVQRRSALRLAGGALSRRVEEWRDRILSLAAEVEACLDHADEGDVPVELVTPDLTGLTEELTQALATPPAERLRDGVRVAIAGPPNAGKSTLLNALVGREAAIVSPIPGTTRDVVEVPVALLGVPFLFGDTAGLRESEDQIEQEGIRRAELWAQSAEIVLWLGDPLSLPAGAIGVFARADIRTDARPSGWISVSAITGEGTSELIGALVERANLLLPRLTELALNRRQRNLLEQCLSAVADARSARDPLLIAEGLRSARAALDALVGRSGVEELLDSLFGRFCIGK